MCKVKHYFGGSAHRPYRGDCGTYGIAKELAEKVFHAPHSYLTG